MTKYLALCLLLLTSTSVPVRDAEAELLPQLAAPIVKVGLVVDGSSTGSTDAAADEQQACAGVAFSRSLKYGESDLNVLDVATGDSKELSRRPVLVFVAGERFAGGNGAPAMAGPIQDQAICFAARHGMVGVRIAYRVGPAYPRTAAGRGGVAGA